MPNETATAPDVPSPMERRSAMVFSTMLLLVLTAVSFPEMPSQTLLGILWTGVGLLMLLLPPETPLPRLWLALAAGFVLTSMIGFLPQAWFHTPPWRTGLESLGLDTGPHAFVQPQLAAETMAGFAVTAITAVYLLGHRIGSHLQFRIAIGFGISVAAWTMVALACHQPGKIFGFFPNRNHTACLLVMATFAGLGCFTQGIRLKSAWKIALAAIPLGVCPYALHFVSESRAGVFLTFIGALLWISLTGVRHLRGNVGKALVLILITVIGIFSIVDSTAKKRLAATIWQIAPAEPSPATTPDNPFAAETTLQADPPMDGRITIYQDTWEMIRHESWTGVGPGQFAQVFPQYREKTTAHNDARCLHPESDWLMMLAETGWPPTTCLAVGLFAVFVSGVRQARRGRARFLKTGCLVAAMLLCLHGLFDVPGHRVGLAWAALLMLAISLRRPGRNGLETGPGPARVCWRVAGLVLVLAGIGLLHAQWSRKPILPSAQANQWMVEAKTLYDADQAAYDLAESAGEDYQPHPAEDPLEQALERVARVITISPLEPQRHFARGVLALHFDDKDMIASQAFAIQSRLEPTRPNLAMEQALAWKVRNPKQTTEHWVTALVRAAAEELRFPDIPHVGNTYGRILQQSNGDEMLSVAALELAKGDFSLQGQWSRSVQPSLLDREMPRLLTGPVSADQRASLFQIWKSRGSKAIVTDFANAHPSLGLSAY